MGSSSRKSTRTPGRRPVVEQAIRLVIAGLFTVAAYFKVADPDAFGVVVWRLFGEGITPQTAVLVGAVVACTEFGLAVGIVLDRGMRVWLVGALVALCVFTLALVRFALMENPPSCGCFSAPHPGGARIEHVAGIGRNVALAWLIVILLPAGDTRRAPVVRARREVAGFSLIELLVVLVVIGVVLGIGLPVFARARVTGKLHERAVIERQVHLALETYMDDHASSFPYFGAPGEPFAPVVINGHEFGGGSYFTVHRWYWASALVPSYIPDREAIEPAVRRERFAERGITGVVAAHAQLTSAAVVDPAYLRTDAGDRPFDPDHFRAGRRSQVVFPSHKAILVSFYGGPGGADRRVAEQGGYPVVFGDGSLRVIGEREINAMPSVERPMLGNISIHGTPDGLSGRDIVP